jgi:uncharacterized protein (TIGR02594 family)
MSRIPRHALACALFFALAGSAAAAPRHYWTLFDDPPAPRVLPVTDDGGRALRFGSGIISLAMRFLGAGNVAGTRGPWCADFAAMVLKKTGHRPLANRTAASALSYGPRTSNPKPGDLIVLGGRHGASHVGFFAGWDRGRVVMVSGNWSHRVSRAVISLRSVSAFIHT